MNTLCCCRIALGRARRPRRGQALVEFALAALLFFGFLVAILEGARWLADQIGVSLSQFAGVGDSDPDLGFLRLVRHSAAPANATPAVRAAVDYVAARAHGLGLLEIVERIIQRQAPGAEFRVPRSEE